MPAEIARISELETLADRLERREVTEDDVLDVIGVTMAKARATLEKEYPQAFSSGEWDALGTQFRFINRTLPVAPSAVKDFAYRLDSVFRLRGDVIAQLPISPRDIGFLPRGFFDMPIQPLAQTKL